jgi:hypothetical protein
MTSANKGSVFDDDIGDVAVLVVSTITNRRFNFADVDALSLRLRYICAVILC